MKVEIVELPIDSIDPLDPPLRRVDWDVVQDLEQSIKSHGVLQPILVRSNNDRYEVVFGNHRYYAARRIEEITTIPAIIKDLSNSTALVLALTENVQRAPLNPYDEGKVYKQILDEGRIHLKQLSSKYLNKSISYITGRIRIFENLCPELVEKIGLGITRTNALYLSKLDKEKQLEVYEKIKEGFKIKQVGSGIGGFLGKPPMCKCPKCGAIHFMGDKRE